MSCWGTKIDFNQWDKIPVKVYLRKILSSLLPYCADFKGLSSGFLFSPQEKQTAPKVVCLQLACLHILTYCSTLCYVDLLCHHMRKSSLFRWLLPVDNGWMPLHPPGPTVGSNLAGTIKPNTQTNCCVMNRHYYYYFFIFWHLLLYLFLENRVIIPF